MGKLPVTWEEFEKGLEHFRGFWRLRKRLGEGFPKRAARIRPPSRNPVLSSLLLPLNGAIDILESWTDSLEILVGNPGFDRVLGDLQSHRDQSEPTHAFYLIEAAAKLHRVGLIVSFDPILPTGFPARPDLMVSCTPTNETLYLELTTQNLSAKQVSGLRLLGVANPKTAFPDVLCSAVWADALSESQLPHLERQIEAAVDQARRTASLVEVVQHDQLTMACCHRSKKDILDQWRASHGLSGDCYGQGPPDHTDELSRLLFKIKRKQKQLPAGYPNIIWLQANSIFNHVGLNSIISTLHTGMKGRPHVAALILCGCNLGTAPPQARRTDLYRFERTIQDDWFRDTLLVWNDNADVVPSSLLKGLMEQAFFGSA